MQDQFYSVDPPNSWFGVYPCEDLFHGLLCVEHMYGEERDA